MSLTLENHQPSLENLPENYLIALTECNAIQLTGEEQQKYLQGQVTCDVNTLTPETLLHGAHCNAKGKVFSCFRLFERDGSYLLFQPKSSIEQSLAELKKFGVFAKVDINTTEQLAFFCLVGTNAPAILKEKFNTLPDSMTPVIQTGSTNLVYIAGNIERYLIIDTKENVEQLVSAFSLPVFPSPIWKLLEIVEGFPYLDNDNHSEYVPQMLNMQAINGISFTKGCYLGQETVARMQYLGKNKKALFALTGKLTNPSAEIIIEKQLGENWRKAGDVIACYISENNQCYLQAVLANDSNQEIKLQLKEQTDADLSLVNLPYSLTQD
ncbi:tRNA-modifying protein YgfZ [Thalassotalea insulae]|nr:tRNA-modifying protein YgfZ [Thalassotalea insulae]